MGASTADGGLLVSRDRGQSFTRVVDGPFRPHLRSLASDPFNSTIVYGVTDWGEVWVYRGEERHLQPSVPVQLPDAVVLSSWFKALAEQVYQ